MHIRPATPDDAEALTDLHLDVWDEAYAGLIPDEILRDRRNQRGPRTMAWRKRIKGSEESHLVAEDHGRLIGFAGFSRGREADETGAPPLQLMALYVRAEFYSAGVGYALFKAAIDDEPAFLWVLDGNQRAVDFYQRQGFDFDGVTKTETVGVERRMVRR